jgi:hypothetical protein
LLSFGCLQDGQGCDGKLLPGQSSKKVVQPERRWEWLYVWDWIPVRNGPSVKGSMVSTGPPTAVLRHEMEGGRPRALGTSGGAVSSHGGEFGLGVQAVWCQASWSAGYRWAGCCADVMRCVVLDLAMTPCWLGQPREFLQEAVWCSASSDDFYTG